MATHTVFAKLAKIFFTSLESVRIVKHKFNKFGTFGQCR